MNHKLTNYFKDERSIFFSTDSVSAAHDVPPEYVLEIISYEYEYRNTYIYIDIY